MVVNYLWPDAMMKPMILHETYTVNGQMLQYYPKDHFKMTAMTVRSFVSPIRQTFDYRYDSSSSIKPQNYLHQSSYQYYQGGVVNSPPPKKVAPGMDQKYQQRQQTQQQQQQQQAMTRPIG